MYNINKAQWVLIGRRSRSSNNCVAVLLAVPQNSHVSRILPRPRFVVLCLAPFTHYRSLVLAVTAAIRCCWLVGVFPALHATHDTVYALVLWSRSCTPPGSQCDPESKHVAAALAKCPPSSKSLNDKWLFKVSGFSFLVGRSWNNK